MRSLYNVNHLLLPAISLPLVLQDFQIPVFQNLVPQCQFYRFKIRLYINFRLQINPHPIDANHKRKIRRKKNSIKDHIQHEEEI